MPTSPSKVGAMISPSQAGVPSCLDSNSFLPVPVPERLPHQREDGQSEVPRNDKHNSKPYAVNIYSVYFAVILATGYHYISPSWMAERKIY